MSKAAPTSNTRHTRASKVIDAQAESRRILVLDDSEAMRNLITLVLSRAGYLVEVGGDGETGWEALAARSYDLLVTDNDMPRLSGLELAARLRSAGSNLPVILVSGWWPIGEVNDYPHLCLAAVLRKPFATSELLDQVQKALITQRTCCSRSVRNRDEAP